MYSSIFLIGSRCPILRHLHAAYIALKQYSVRSIIPRHLRRKGKDNTSAKGICAKLQFVLVGTHTIIFDIFINLGSRPLLLLQLETAFAISTITTSGIFEKKSPHIYCQKVIIVYPDPRKSSRTSLFHWAVQVCKVQYFSEDESERFIIE